MSLRNDDDDGSNDDCCLRRHLDDKLLRLSKYARLLPEERNARKAAVERIRTASAALFSRMTDDDNNDCVHVDNFGLFATLDVCVFLSDVDMSLWSVVKPTKSKGKEENKDKKPKIQTTTTTATHKDHVQKWANVLGEAERLCDAKNNENGVSEEGHADPINVDNKEKSG